jgi:hypothetical protein
MFRQAADWLDDAEARVPQTTDLLARVRSLVQPRGEDAETGE